MTGGGSWLRIAALVVIAGTVSAITGVGAWAAPMPVHGTLTSDLSVTVDARRKASWNNALQLRLDEAVGPVDLLATLRLTQDSAETDARLEMSEAALIWYGGDWRVNAGYQVLNWGTALKLNPANVVNPVDVTDPDMEGLPRQLLAVTHYPGPDWEVNAVWIPQFRPALAMIPGMPHVPVQRPNATWEDTEWAARALYRGRGFDMALIGFYGWDDFPTVKLTLQGPVAVFERAATIGAGYSSSIGDAGMWAEGRYTIYPYADDDKHPVIEAVFGGDYSLTTGMRLVGQMRWVDDGTDDTALMLMAAVEGDVASIHTWNVGLTADPDAETWSLRPQIGLSLADALALTVYGSLTNTDAPVPGPLGTPDHIGARLAASF